MRCGIGSRRWGWNRDARSQRGARPNSWGGAVRPRGVLASWVFSRAKPFSARKLSKAVSDLVFVHRVGFSQNKLGVLVSFRPAGIADLNFRHPGRYAQETEVLRRYCLSVYLPNHDSLLPGHVLWPGRAKLVKASAHLLIVGLSGSAEPEQRRVLFRSHLDQHPGAEVCQTMNVRVVGCSVLSLLLQNTRQEKPDRVRLKIQVAVAGHPQEASYSGHVEDFFRPLVLAFRRQRLAVDTGRAIDPQTAVPVPVTHPPAQLSAKGTAEAVGLESLHLGDNVVAPE